MSVSRRQFLLGGSSACLMASGCRTAGELLGMSPDLRFGVVSDIHVTTPGSTRLFEEALRVFRSRGVDAVMIPGDLTDWGLRSSLEYVKAAWDRVFANTGVVPLFCTGNHDFEGYWYGDMTVEMHANGYSEHERLTRWGVDRNWTEVFHEYYAPIRVRTVKGYDFVSAEWKGVAGFPAWMKANGARFRGTKPFFYFQHLPIRGTTADSGDGRKGDAVKDALSDFPNAVAFTGHTHAPFVDERSLWQDDFTVLAVPSLSYACFPAGHENGGGNRRGESKQTMQAIPDRRDLRGGQGYLVSVYADEMVVERLDLEEGGVRSAPDWVVPLPVGEYRDLHLAERADRSRAPEFPEGAAVASETRNTENRVGRWTIAMTCEFPAAEPEPDARVFDYRIRAIPLDGSEPLVKRFLSPAYSRLAKYEPARMRFWFDAAELPQEKAYVLEVTAFNCFGKASRPIYSKAWRSEPGLACVSVSDRTN